MLMYSKILGNTLTLTRNQLSEHSLNLQEVFKVYYESEYETNNELYKELYLLRETYRGSPRYYLFVRVSGVEDFIGFEVSDFEIFSNKEDKVNIEKICTNNSFTSLWRKRLVNELQHNEIKILRILLSKNIYR